MEQQFDIVEARGLSEEEAQRRIAEEGYNELPTYRKRNILLIAFDVIREPMFLLLVAIGVVYLVLGDRSQALILLSFVVVIIFITFYQERKTERALEALRDLSSPRANVIRGGEQKRIPGREVTKGDQVLLAEGDRVPADGVLVDCVNLMVDESLLTGESVAVVKGRGEPCLEKGRPGGEGSPFVWSGTLVVKGRGVAEVVATGPRTEIGKIGTTLKEIEPEPTSLQVQTRRIVLNIAVLAAVLCSLVIIVYGLTRYRVTDGVRSHDWLGAVLAGLTLAMAMIPEEFPVVLTIFLTMGARRMSKEQVLTREVRAVETLGAATVLCVDKTGTITFNRISVSGFCVGGEFYDLVDHKREPLPEDFHEVVEFGILASQKDPFDPIEKAVKRLGDRKLFRTEHLHEDWVLMREYPLSERLMALSNVWKSPDGRDYIIAAKGAPEAVADLCHMDPDGMSRIKAEVGRMAERGLRVLGVAKATFSEADLPVDQHDFIFEFLGLVGLVDPVRPNVADSVEECHRAGIRVVMITGDYPGTAMNVARQIGLENADSVITGPELDEMDDETLKERIADVDIFARVVPEQKLRLVQALKENGEIVAMTGDGVNDAPALKAAQIGIAMGARGTDVAREASALVLLDDDFSSIRKAVRMGRRIFDNLKKAMAYIFAIHVPIAGISLIPVFFPGLFEKQLILYPVHIAFLELIIDPACSVVFEAEGEEADIMERPPRNIDDPLFGWRTMIMSSMQGLSVLVIVMAVYAVSRAVGQGGAECRALAFATLVIANLGLILTNRSWTHTIKDTLRTPNRALWWVVGGTFAFLALVLYVPALKKVFSFSTLSAVDVAVALGAGMVSIAWFEALKALRSRRRAV